MNPAEKYYTENYDLLLKMTAKKITDIDMAEDIVQEVFYSALRKRIFENHPNPSAWMHLAISYEIAHYFRAKKILEPLDELEFPFFDTYYEDIETSEFLRSFLLESDYYIVKTHFIDEIPEKHIAAVLGISVNTLRVRIYRIKKKLRDIYGAKKGISK